MGQSYNRISENVLFALLLAALGGWFSATAAVDLPLALVSATSFAVSTQPERS
ncbi:MAG: hypothetical protein JO133_07190 [Burkholderiaceae bacterium]|nr:hypothetical protein [Burkholderiaceae bacterium]